VSALTLGGGGIGAVWGATSAAEAIATVRAAADAGITLLDLAPLYGSAEQVVGEAYEGRLPEGVRVVTKCRLGNPPAHEVYERLSTSLDESFDRLRVSYVDALVLHGAVVAEAPDSEGEPRLGVPIQTSLDRYRTAIVPAFERLVAEGRIGCWGINAIELPSGIFGEGPLPTIAECVTNFMGTPGGIVPYNADVSMRELIDTVRGAGVGVMGIRAVQAGALTDKPDREFDAAETADYQRAAAFRALARELGTTAAALAHRYALSMSDVGTVVLGVKNRAELDECLAAEAAGPLAPDIIAAVEATVP
jgi:aryl-alcohol dehydrogenase-like predicted oxidoreductase